MTEANFTKKVKNYLDTLDKCWFFKVWGGGMQTRGIPDILGVVNGKFFALELKATDGKSSALQRRTVDLITKAGGYAKVVYPVDYDQMVNDLEAIKNGVYDVAG